MVWKELLGQEKCGTGAERARTKRGFEGLVVRRERDSWNCDVSRGEGESFLCVQNIPSQDPLWDREQMPVSYIVL